MNTTIRDKAIAYLARRDHSRFELQQKLLAANFDSDQIKIVLDALIAEGLQDDARMTANYIRQRQQAGFGPERISYELEVRGISKKIIKEKLDAHSIEWRREMTALLERRYPDNMVVDPTEKARFLASRGFPQEDIIRYLNIEGLEEND